MGSEGWLSCKQFITIGCCVLLGLSCWWHCVPSLPSSWSCPAEHAIKQRETFGKPVALSLYRASRKTHNHSKLVTIIFMCCSSVSECPRITAPCLKPAFRRYCTKFKSTWSLPLALCQVANLQCQTAAVSNLQPTNIHCSRHTDIFWQSRSEPTNRQT
jgi:hypothetical protein